MSLAATRRNAEVDGAHPPAPLQVLALRTFATSAVYFWDDRCRQELADWRKLLRKIWGRLCSDLPFCGTSSAARSGAGKVRFQKQKLEDVMLIPARSDQHDEVYDNPAFDGGELAPGADTGQRHLDLAATSRRSYSPATRDGLDDRTARADGLPADGAASYDYAA